MQVLVSEDAEGKGIVAHFLAHDNKPISCMAFNPSGKCNEFVFMVLKY